MTEPFVRQALDPARSVVVEACAGSGKTWLLVSRILRILLTGARPGDILAITYTRKAAREIEARLRLWLRDLARLDDAAACAFLEARGLDAAEALAVLPRARGLIETVEQASPAITITTFHGWFGRILSGASLNAGLAGFALAEAEGPLMDEAWALFARRCAEAPDGPVATALGQLYTLFGSANTRSLLDAFVSRRGEWQVFAAGASLESVLADMAAAAEVSSDEEALAMFYGAADLEARLLRYASYLGKNTASDQKAANALIDALAIADDAPRFEALVPIFLTGEGTVRVRKASKAQAGRLTEAGEADLLMLHESLAGALLDCVAARLELRVLEFNAAALTAGTALLTEFEAFKRQRRLMDYADLEIEVDRLLDDADRAPYLQARLDARYRHLLLDEFQDTNPVQWRILLAWLAAYEADAYRPSIFLVGDPKQSIYRFRRADYRIFNHAAEWLSDGFDAVRLPNNHTWRNAPAVVDVVNALFVKEPAFVGFAEQAARRGAREGMVHLPALVSAPELADDADDGSLRDPLNVARRVRENLARRQEAQVMVSTLFDWVGDRAIDAHDGPRPMQWGDVLILTRTRGILPEYERALRESGVPYLSVSRGQLLSTLEAADLTALLRFLTTPSDDLALAHCLRAPWFDISDAALLALAAEPDGDWWTRLRAVAAGAGPHAAALASAADLLSGWMALAAHLPVHDLLDRIYDQADVMAAYRRRVPPPMWAGVAANLEAFLALSVDGGRYPSLPRFVDELQRLGRAGDDEAPDEGALIDGASQGRVRIMTIHGAKGLEAPVVWLIDANNTHQRPDSYQPLIDWPAGAPRPTHFSLHATSALAGRARAAIFDAEAAARERETLNLLYVAITRAEQIFVASGSEARGDVSQTYYGRLRRALDDLGAAETYGKVSRIASPVTEPDAALAEVAPAVPVRVSPVGERVVAPVANTAMDFGTAMHALIEAATTPGAATPVALSDAVRQAAEAILNAPDLQPFFDPAQFEVAYNEVEIIDDAGRLGRIDRLVLRDDAAWVIDYKSGHPEPALMEKYRQQMRDYCRAVSAMFSTLTARALLVFADGSREHVEPPA
ncbi:MAG: UvrD-helicase domain-containing protein [Rhodocyclaceae bacterium]|nr:UvrD-helicase domain-containing protein [Rhodocyclaceae bacterium]